MKEQIEKYLKDPDGNPSSTRLFSFWILRFFFMWNVLIILLLGGLFAIVGGKGIENWLSSIVVVAGYGFVFNILLLLGIFVPKQLGKIAEIRKIIEIIKNGGNGNAVIFKPEELEEPVVKPTEKLGL